MGLTENFAKKQFASEAIQQSWRVHMGAFGPLLKDAFRDDDAAKIELTAALNYISRRDLSKGLKKLETLQKRCKAPSDEAALHFFQGLCSQMSGQMSMMLHHYRQAEELGHRFYMPHLHEAKFYERGRLFDRAVRSYLKAERCFEGTGLGPQEKNILGSIHAGLASCYTQMHFYEMAERSLSSSRGFQPDAPGRSMVEALLHAAQGRAVQTWEAFAQLRAHAPAAAAQAEGLLKGILDGTDPMYTELPLKEGEAEAFWNWFRDGDLKELNSRLNALFPYAEGSIEAGIYDGEIWLPHSYVLSLERGYGALLAVCPEDISGEWDFEILPYLLRK